MRRSSAKISARRNRGNVLLPGQLIRCTTTRMLTRRRLGGPVRLGTSTQTTFYSGATQATLLPRLALATLVVGLLFHRLRNPISLDTPDPPDPETRNRTIRWLRTSA